MPPNTNTRSFDEELSQEPASGCTVPDCFGDVERFPDKRGLDRDAESDNIKRNMTLHCVFAWAVYLGMFSVRVVKHSSTSTKYCEKTDGHVKYMAFHAITFN